MKSVIKKTLGLLVMAVALVSCTKDDDNAIDIDTGGGISGALLLIEETVDGQTLHTFEYDALNRMTAFYTNTAGGMHTSTFAYDDSDRLIAVARKNGEEIYLQETYVYGAGDKPVSGVWMHPGDDEETLIQYAYTQNTVTETLLLPDVEEPQINSYTFDNNGNLVTAQIGSIIQEFGDFDDKHSCYTNYPWAWKVGYVNNYQSVKLTGSADHVWEYTYNEAGYPVKATVYDRASKELVETRAYRYKNAN